MALFLCTTHVPSMTVLKNVVSAETVLTVVTRTGWSGFA